MIQPGLSKSLTVCDLLVFMSFRPMFLFLLMYNKAKHCMAIEWNNVKTKSQAIVLAKLRDKH